MATIPPTERMKRYHQRGELYRVLKIGAADTYAAVALPPQSR
jgi:hypothetical protein